MRLTILSALPLVSSVVSNIPATSARGIDPRTKATADAARRRAFRPYDEASGRRIDYGDDHPWEVRRQRRDLTDVMMPGSNLDSDQIEYVLGYSVHRPIRILFETSALDAARGQTDEKDRKIDLLKNEVLPAIGDTWSRALAVVPVKGRIPVPRDACFGLADYPSDFEVRGADIVVIVDVTEREELACVAGSDLNALAVAAPCETDQWDRPVIGFINFCLVANMRETFGDTGGGADEEVARFISIGAHEVGHALGMVDQLFKYFREPGTGDPLTSRPFRRERVTCVDGVARYEYRPSSAVLSSGTTSNGARYFELVTPRLAAVVKNQFNCPSMKGARLENQPTGQSCFGSHLDERLFFTELMGPVYSDFSNALSPITLAFFEDSGWYVANYSSAVPSTFGHGAGCDFVNNDCIVDGQLPDWSKGFFCNQEIDFDMFGRADVNGLTCDPSRTHKAFCDLAARDDVFGSDPAADIPSPFQYFPLDADLGAFNMWLADFCPIATIDLMDCQDPTNSGDGEYFGQDSRCYDVTVSTTTDSNYPYAFCFKTSCNAEKMVVEVGVGNTKITCDEDGQIHYLGRLWGNGYLECPRFAVTCPELVCPGNCAGRGVCDWDAAGGPKCDCDDPADDSPGCFGSSAGSSAAAGTTAATTAPPATTAKLTPARTTPPAETNPDNASGSTWEAPVSVFKTTVPLPSTEPPEDEGLVIVFAPEESSGRSLAIISGALCAMVALCGLSLVL